MSRTEQLDVKQNVAKKTLQWKSGESAVAYYDKEADGGDGANVALPLPFEFVVLSKDYISFNGYCEAEKKGFWSNEVKSSNKDALVHVRLGNEVARTFKKSEWKGTKNNPGVKDDPDLKGCKYTQILYISAQLPGDNQPEIYRMMLNGASFSGGITADKKGNEHEGQENDGWVRFTSNLCKTDANALFKTAITITEAKSKKNGSVNYTMPVFTATELDADMEALYEDQYKKVLDWFKYYEGKQAAYNSENAETTATPVSSASPVSTVPDDDADL